MMLLVIAMTSALAVGGAFVARQVASSQRLAESASALEPVAESALIAGVAAWDSTMASAQPIGITRRGLTSSVSGTTTDVWITRIGNDLYWLVAEARTASRPVLRRRLGLTVRITNGTPRPLSQRPWSELP